MRRKPEIHLYLPIVLVFCFIYLFDPQLDTMQVRKTVKHTSASMSTVRHQGRALTDPGVFRKKGTEKLETKFHAVKLLFITCNKKG